MKCLSWLVLLLALATESAIADDADVKVEVEVERWDRAICLHTEQRYTDGLGTMASGFVINHEDTLYLVSAVHAAQETNARTRVVYRTNLGESRWVHLGGLVDSKRIPWQDFENSDLSIAPLHDSQENKPYYGELEQLAVPFDRLIQEIPKRTTQIEITGYPLSFGSTPPVAPLTMVAHVASRELTSAARWGTEKIFYAVPTVASGTSGGPVFESNENLADSAIVGMYIGFISDTSGAKLSKIIPAHIIRTAIAAMSVKRRERAE